MARRQRTKPQIPRAFHDILRRQARKTTAPLPTAKSKRLFRASLSGCPNRPAWGVAIGSIPQCPSYWWHLTLRPHARRQRRSHTGKGDSGGYFRFLAGEAGECYVLVRGDLWRTLYGCAPARGRGARGGG